MLCRLCLINIDTSEAIPLYLTSIDNLPSIYIDIIDKYLQLKISSNDSVSSSLCLVCAKTLRDFDRFYLMVDDKQKSLVNTSILVKDEPNETCNQQTEYETVHLEDTSSYLLNANEGDEHETIDDEQVQMCQAPDIKIEEYPVVDHEPEKAPNEARRIFLSELSKSMAAHYMEERIKNAPPVASSSSTFTSTQSPAFMESSFFTSNPWKRQKIIPPQCKGRARCHICYEEKALTKNNVYETICCFCQKASCKSQHNRNVCVKCINARLL